VLTSAGGTITGTTTFSGGVANAYGFGVGTAVPSSGAGITFPATQSASTNANTLDDYEEGTWTPFGGGITVNSGTPVYAGRYTKIGNMVYLDWRVTGGNVTITAGSSYLGGMPFTVNNTFQGWGAYGNAATNSVGGFFMAEATVTNMYASTTITGSNLSGSVAYATN
jgi:hypothetical protein